MGAKCAPSIANLYLAILEKNFLFIHKPLWYSRFIDDILIIINESFDINLLISSFRNLKLNVVTNKVVNFLDLTIKLDETTNFLSFSLYTKPTNTFSYLLSTSNHPDHIFKNIPKSIFIRLRRICSLYSDYLFFARKLTDQLRKRGYEKKYIETIARSVSNLDRLTILPYKIKKTIFDDYKNTLFFKFPFDTNNPEIKSALFSAYNSISKVEALKNYKFKIINSMQQNLSSLLIHDHKLLTIKTFRFSRCS